MSIKHLSLFMVSLGLLGCPAGDDGDTEGATTGSGTEGATGNTDPDGGPAGDDVQVTSTAGSSDDGLDSSSDGGPGTSGSSDGGSSGGSSDDAATEPGTDSSGGSETGTGDVCEEAPGDSECSACVKGACCDQLTECGSDADCTCFQTCAAKNPGMAGALACATECDITIPELLNPETVVGALATCTQGSCPKCVE